MRILYVTTTFPVYSETFLQREARAMRALGSELRILSLHRGEPEFDDFSVDRFSKWELLTLLWRLPWLAATRWRVFSAFLGEVFRQGPSDWLNFWENLLGFGAAVVRERAVRDYAPDVIHCVWSSAPAAFGWICFRLGKTPFSMGAHAYDVFEKGGDWLLATKAREALLVHSSTESAASRLRQIVPPEKIHMIRRGMDCLPECKPLRSDRSELRLICVARLVEKKGFPYQIRIYEALREAGIPFEARIVGEGPLRDDIQNELVEKGLNSQVTLQGRLSQEETMASMAWADILFHTGIIARNGDRDGLPNVIPEAMASGVIVMASPVSGVVEAIREGETGLLRDVADAEGWAALCDRIREDDALCQRLRSNARNWVEKAFSAELNTGKLLEAMSKGLDANRNEQKG